MSETIDDVRAILRDFRASPWRDLFVKSNDWQLFLAKPGGGPNPLQAVACMPDDEEAIAAGVCATAPHAGVFVPQVQAQQTVSQGDLLGSVRVLDRETPILADAPGVIQWLRAEGTFVEFANELVRIEQS